ncbi:MAG: serine/threonine-protein kinase [bacterium]
MRRAGPYLLGAQVGQGAFSTVWMAVHEATGLQVAIKLARIENETARQRFQREITLLSRLDHPNLLRLYGVGETDDGLSYMALEWVDGGLSLEGMYAQRFPFSWVEAAELGRAVARGLFVAHEHHILHRDVKPSNILVPGGRLADAKLSDFDALGDLERENEESGRLTRSGILAGTPAYMSPEQLRGAALSTRADIYGLGLVMRNMLWAPEGDQDLRSIFVRRLRVEEEVPNDDAIPLELRRLIVAMLHRIPEERPESADVVANRLTSILNVAGQARSHRVGGGVPEGRATYAEIPGSMARGTRVLDASLQPPTFDTPAAPAVGDAQPRTSSRVWATALVALALILIATVVWQSTGAIPNPGVGPGAAENTLMPRSAIAQGIGLMLAGLLAGTLIGRAIDDRRTALERQVTLALTGSRDKLNLTRTMILTVDAIVQQTAKLDVQFLGATIISMVGEYNEAKESSDKQQALVRATELLEKLLEKSSPWYVRNSKWIVAAASLVGLVSGASKLVGDLGNLFR